MDRVPAVAIDKGVEPTGQVLGMVEFRDVWFQYKGRDKVGRWCASICVPEDLWGLMQSGHTRGDVCLDVAEAGQSLSFKYRSNISALLFHVWSVSRPSYRALVYSSSKERC